MTKRQSKARRADADETRAAIIEAAITLFAARGFDGVTYRDVAAQAARPLGVVSYHFPSKDALWQAAAMAIHADFVRNFDQTRSGGDDSADRFSQARDTLRAYIAYFARDPRLFRFVFQLSLDDNARLRWYVGTLVAPFSERFTSLFEELAARNGIARDDPRFTVLLYSLVGAATIIYAAAPEVRLTHGVDPARPDLVEAHLDLLLDRFLPAGDLDG